MPSSFKACHTIRDFVNPVIILIQHVNCGKSGEENYQLFEEVRGLSVSHSSIYLCGSANTVWHSFSGFSSDFIVSRTRESTKYKDSSDRKVAGTGIEVRTSRNERVVGVEEQMRQMTLIKSDNVYSKKFTRALKKLGLVDVGTQPTSSQNKVG